MFVIYFLNIVLMKKQKLNVIVSLFIFSIIWISIFLFLNKNEDIQKNDENNIKLLEFWEKLNSSNNNNNNNNSKDITKISLNDINNSFYSINKNENFNEKIKILLSSSLSDIDKLKIPFIQSFMWNYKDALFYRDNLCKNSKNLDKEKICRKINFNLISYRPIDYEWKILDWVDLFVDWINLWKLKWVNEFKIYDNFIHRIKLSKKGYIDFYKKISLLNYWTFKESITPKMLKAYWSETRNIWDSFQYSTQNFNYNILSNSFSYKNWDKVYWNIDIYFFDITWEEWNINALNLDSFSDDWFYQWGSMTTYWMPLIKAYKWNEELKIVKDIMWKSKILNTDKALWIKLEEVPKNEWLNYSSLEKYNIPPFWCLNQEYWIWISSKMKILDNNWNYEFNMNCKN